MTDAGEDARVDLGRGVTMPMVGFGTWRLQRARAYEAVRDALEVGYRHIDTATMYQNEAEVGRAVRDSGLDRREVFITTKLPPENAGRERATIDASLRALGTEYVDLWLVHWPPRGSASVPVWEQFRKVRDEGLARAVGVSNYDVAQVDELISASGEHPAVNQIPWSLSGYDQRLLAAMRELGVVVEGYSSLKNTDLRNPILAQIADRHHVTPAQVVLRWHIQHGIPVIPKSAQPERIASNFALSGFSLSPSEMSALDRLSRRLPGGGILTCWCRWRKSQLPACG
jgi:2,5-diketo-D-gluconate reductase A